MSRPVASETSHAPSPDPSSHARTIYDDPAGEADWFDGEDDDDMDCELSIEESEDNEFFDPSEEAEAEADFFDADDGMSGVEIEFSANFDQQDEAEPNENVETETEGSASTRPTPNGPGRRRIEVPMQLLQQFGVNGLRRFLEQYSNPGIGVGSGSDEEEEIVSGPRRKGRPKRSKINNFPPVPSEEGKKLMDEGEYGRNQWYRDRLKKRKSRLSHKLMWRELGLENESCMRPASSVVQDLLPSSKADKIVHYSSRCYSGQFSDDGNFFFSCAQDFKVRMYDTSNPYDWKYYKTVIYPYGQWTITDASLSPDNKYLAYSSIRSTVCLSLTDPESRSEPWLLDFSDSGESRGRGRRHGWHGYSHFGIWSIRFSGDGREIVAGTSGPSVCVYDLERRQTIINIEDGHSEHVNAVCFGDSSSPHILYSGSDDTLIKVWDRRSLGDGRAAGVFVGHTEGLTYVDSKGDGRYVLSNGKDQTMKLWDLRRMMSTENASKLNPHRYTTGFDYRFMNYPASKFAPHPHDCSLVTYRGHSVLKTLIRCHFSPPGSSNSRYVYSGSEDGSVYVYNIDATLAGKIDVNEATRNSRPRDPDSTNTYAVSDRTDESMWKTCVRDASWHPNAPMIAATSWNGWGMSAGTCTTHSWNDDAEDDEGIPKLGQSVDQRLVPYKVEEPEAPSKARGTLGQWRERLRSRRVTPAADQSNAENAW